MFCVFGERAVWPFGIEQENGAGITAGSHKYKIKSTVNLLILQQQYLTYAPHTYPQNTQENSIHRFVPYIHSSLNSTLLKE